jgi:hypothetical protein
MNVVLPHELAHGSPTQAGPMATHTRRALGGEGEGRARERDAPLAALDAQFRPRADEGATLDPYPRSSLCAKDMTKIFRSRPTGTANKAPTKLFSSTGRANIESNLSFA